MIDGEDPHLHELHDHKEKSKKRSMEGVAVISDDSLHVFAREGDDFVTALPFQVIAMPLSTINGLSLICASMEKSVTVF